MNLTLSMVLRINLTSEEPKQSTPVLVKGNTRSCNLSRGKSASHIWLRHSSSLPSTFNTFRFDVPQSISQTNNPIFLPQNTSDVFTAFMKIRSMSIFNQLDANIKTC